MIVSVEVEETRDSDMLWRQGNPGPVFPSGRGFAAMPTAVSLALLMCVYRLPAFLKN